MVESMEFHFVFIFWFRNRLFDIDRAREAANLIKGKHDFRTFMGTTHSDNVRTSNELLFIDVLITFL